MSCFECKVCGVAQVDDCERGYIAGCAHHPPEHRRFVRVFFGGDAAPVKAFYDGAWYKSSRSKKNGLAIHPTHWANEND